ncbi:MAG: maleylpyruvate isomerase family mycothiol-dependent enzyme [Jatrophihabitantaceae bacterium]
MEPFDEELTALLALDALEPDEQADSELRIGTFPFAMAETSAGLAELAAAEPPAGLRAATLYRATERRAAGRPIAAATACDPPDAFRRTITDLRRLLDSLSEADWNLPAHPQHGRVRDLLAHLVGVERLSVRWLQSDGSLPPIPDHVAATRPVIDELATTDPRQVARQWHDTASAVSAAAAVGDPDRLVSFHDLRISVSGFLVMRTFELWAHSMDICAAIGRSRPGLDAERMALMSGRLMVALPEALAYRGSNAPGRTARFVLTGVAGGCFTVPLDPGDDGRDPDFTLVADAVDLCRIAAGRLRPDELVVAVEGDRMLAEQVLAGLDAYSRD